MRSSLAALAERLDTLRLLVGDLAKAHGTGSSVGNEIADHIIREITAVREELNGIDAGDPEAVWYADADEA